MKLFTIDKNGKFVQFKEERFKSGNKEIDLEILLENNPEYFFDNEKILIIGRQVTTNLNTYVDLLGIDELGNSVVIELKRDKTPRETLAQLIEYASFIDNLDYQQLNEIYRNYSGDENTLEEYHHEFFKADIDQQISWNKSSKLVIVAQEITPDIKQTSLYLRKKGIDIYCLEFKYFVNEVGNKMISSDFVVGDEEYIRQKVSITSQLPKINKEEFFKSLDANGIIIFGKLFEFADSQQLMFRWGSKGFSMNLVINNSFVALCFGYPPNSVFKQSIYTGFEEISKKVNNPVSIIDYYKNELNKIGKFVSANTNLKWLISKKYSDNEIVEYLTILENIINMIKQSGLLK